MPALDTRYGYIGTYRPPKTPRVRTSGLALAAAGRPSQSNPFGFQTARNTTGYREAPITQMVRPPSAGGARPAQAPALNPGAIQQQQPVGPPTPGGYDLNTDPALQQVQALTGLSDEQANAQALKERQQELLAYGDPRLAAAVLGQGDPTVQAAGQNPTSTLAQLKQQRDRNLRDLTEALNQQNLLYSGYRAEQEQQAAQDYQNQLASAAGGVNSALDQISGNLAAALAQNEQQRQQALQDAENRRLQAALAAQNAAPAAPAPPSGGAGGGSAPPAPSNPLNPPAATFASPAEVYYAPNVPYNPPGTGTIAGAANQLAALFAPPAPAPTPRRTVYGSAAQRRRQTL